MNLGRSFLSVIRLKLSSNSPVFGSLNKRHITLLNIFSAGDHDEAPPSLDLYTGADYPTELKKELLLKR